MKRREFFRFLAASPVAIATGVLAVVGEDEQVLAGTKDIGVVYNNGTRSLEIRGEGQSAVAISAVPGQKVHWFN